MNIFPERDDGDPPTAPPDWTVEYGSGSIEEREYFYADVMRAGKVMFRIGIGGVSEEAKARKQLAAKARQWIDEFLIREQQSGTSPQGN
jgi:hypothetical protein